MGRMLAARSGTWPYTLAGGANVRITCIIRASVSVRKDLSRAHHRRLNQQTQNDPVFFFASFALAEQQGGQGFQVIYKGARRPLRLSLSETCEYSSYTM
jgi:hypothetical protein